MRAGMIVGSDLVSPISSLPKEREQKPWRKTFEEAFVAVKRAPPEIKAMGILGAVCVAGAAITAFGFIGAKPYGLSPMNTSISSFNSTTPAPLPTIVNSTLSTIVNSTSSTNGTDDDMYFEYDEGAVLPDYDYEKVDLNCNSPLRESLIAMCSGLLSAGMVGLVRWGYHTAINLPNANIEVGLVKGTQMVLIGYGAKSVAINFKDPNYTHEMIEALMELFKYGIPKGVDLGDIYEVVVETCDAVDKQLNSMMAGDYILKEVQIWLDRNYDTAFSKYRHLVGLDAPATPLLWIRPPANTIAYDDEGDYAEITDVPERPDSVYMTRTV